MINIKLVHDKMFIFLYFGDEEIPENPLQKTGLYNFYSTFCWILIENVEL
jgi:hypothetical protein